MTDKNSRIFVLRYRFGYGDPNLAAVANTRIGNHGLGRRFDRKTVGHSPGDFSFVRGGGQRAGTISHPRHRARGDSLLAVD